MMNVQSLWRVGVVLTAVLSAGLQLDGLQRVDERVVVQGGGPMVAPPRDRVPPQQPPAAGTAFIDGVVVSGLERLVKPDPRLYRVFCERYGLAPESCVFIDDSEPNIVAACKFGMHGIHFTDPAQLRKELIGLGLPLKK